MIRSGNRLLIVFLVCSFVFFAVALIVEEFALFDSDVDVQQNGTSGGAFGIEDAAESLASASATASGDQVTLSSQQFQLVSTALSPFTNVPGKPRFALDLVNVALERVGITATTVIVDEASLTLGLLSGKFDGSVSLSMYAEQGRALVYSQPYLENRLILVGRQGSDVSATSLADLTGMRVALVAGYAYGESVELTDGPIYVDSDSEEDSVSRLLNGDVDYTLMDDLVIQYLVSNHEEEARTRLAIGSTPLLTSSIHFAVRRSLSDADSIISRFNDELRGMIVDQTYHRLLHLDWIRTDVDSDGRTEYVPHDDRPGPQPPERSYELFVSGGPPEESGTMQRYYFGGNIYEGWPAVPGRYKAPDSSRPGPRLRTVNLFNFTW